MPKGMRTVRLSSVACPAVLHFHLKIGMMLGGGGEVTEHEMCVLIFSATSV